MGTWTTLCQRFFLWWVYQAEAIPKVGSTVGNSVAVRGDLMTAEDSRDEGGVAGVRYDP